MTTRREYRYDRGPLLRAYKRETDGAVLAEGIAARECVLVYRRDDRTTIRELVTADAIRSGARLLSRAPVTLGHPPENVTPENAKRYVVGDVDGEVQIENGGFTRIRAAVRDAAAIQALQQGTVELSMGYACDIDPTPGVHPEFGAYDARQIHRDTNHLAIVDTARAGRDARLRVDAAETVDLIRADGAPTAGSPARSKTMLSILLQGLALLGIANRYDSEELAASALVDALRARKDASERADAERAIELANAVKARDTEKTRADAAEKARDTEKTRADAAEAELKKLQTEAKTRADGEARTALAPLCVRYRIDAAQHKELPALKRAIATASFGAELPSTWTEAHVDVEVERARKDHAEGLEAGGLAFTAIGGEGGGAGGRADGLQGGGGGSGGRARARHDRWGGKPIGGAA